MPQTSTGVDEQHFLFPYVRLATHLFDVPVSAISIRRGRHFVMVSWAGRLAPSVHLLLSTHLQAAWESPDPYVYRHPGGPYDKDREVPFFAGIPLRDSDEVTIGLLWLTDVKHRSFTPVDRQSLVSLGQAVSYVWSRAGIEALLYVEREEKNLAEIALRESEQRWQRIVDNHPHPILISVDETVVYGNPALAQLNGLSSSTPLIGRPVSDLIASGTDQSLPPEWPEIFRQSRPGTFQRTIARKDGDTRIIEWSCVPIEYGGRKAIQAVLYDLTREKQIEDTLRYQGTLLDVQRLVAELFLSSPDWEHCFPLVTERIARSLGLEYILALGFDPGKKDGAGTIVYEWHHPARRALRKDPGTVKWLGSLVPTSELASGPDAEPITGVYGDLPYLAAGIHVQQKPWGCLVVAGKPDRSVWTPAEHTTINVIARTIGAAINRAWDEAALRSSEERFIKTFSASPVAAFICTRADDVIRVVNDRFCSLTGYETGELIGRSLADFSLFDHSGTSVVPEDRGRESAGRDSSQWQIRTRSGDFRTVLAATEVLTFNNEPCYLGTLVDLTDHLTMQQEVVQISEFERRRIGSDLHDGLGSHLTGIALLVSGARTLLMMGDRRALSEIDEIIHHINDSIRQVQSTARLLNPVTLERNGLKAALLELAQHTRHLARIECTCSVAEGIPDPPSEIALHLYRIAQEALNNAVKYARASRINLVLEAEGQALVLSVSDDGQGFQPDTVRSDGLGLQTMKNRADFLRGRLEITSAPGKGTMVRCVAPGG